jgi:uncharacterized protein YaiE (UPF0345 family)
MPKSKKQSLNVHFIAPAHEVKVFYDGQLVVHTSLLADGHAQSYVFSVRGGPHKLGTLPKLDLQVVSGPCAISVDGAKAKTLKAGAKFNLPPGSTFELTATKSTALVSGVPKPGPGLENGMQDEFLL